MTRSRSCSALALLAAGAATVLSTPAQASDPALAARLDTSVAPLVDAGDFQGVVVAIRDGEAPIVRTYGQASVELDRKHWSDAIFMIGSISKQFTAAAILLLEEDGKLATSDPVGKHLSSFPHGDRMTIDQLLTHTAGVADVYSLPRFGRTGGRAGSFADVVADLGAEELTHAPGEAYLYSNGGYSVLAAIIERVSGEGYGDFLSRRIFAPLDMLATAHDARGPAVPGRVPGYEPWGARDLTPSAKVHPAYTTGSGSLWSSAEDLVKWNAALHGGELLSPTSYDKMTRDHGNGYGYGVSIFRRFDRPVIGHDGRVAGYASDLARYVDDRLTVIVLSNVESVARDLVRVLAAAAVLGVEVEFPDSPAFASSTPDDLEELVGVYSFGPALEVSVTLDDGRLLARANQGGSSELVPLAEGAWFSRMLYATVHFGRDEDDKVDRLLWGAGEGAPVGIRAN